MVVKLNHEDFEAIQQIDAYKKLSEVAKDMDKTEIVTFANNQHKIWLNEFLNLNN